MVTNLIAEMNTYGLPLWLVAGVGGLLALAVLFFGLSQFTRRRALPEPATKTKVTRLRDNPSRHGSGEERRRYPRRGGNPTPILINNQRGKDEPWPGMVVDRSEGGLCLLVDREVTDGSVLKVRVKMAPQHVPWIMVETRYCRPVGERYQVGCQFVEAPPLNLLLFFG